MPLFAKLKHKRKNDITVNNLIKKKNLNTYSPYYAEINTAYHKNNKIAGKVCNNYLRAACARQLTFGKFTRKDIWNDLKKIENNPFYPKPHWIITRNPQWFEKCLQDFSYKLIPELIP